MSDYELGRRQWEKEAREEIKDLLDKKTTQGWNEKDVDRYHFLIRSIGED